MSQDKRNSTNKMPDSINNGMDIFMALRKQAENNKIQDLSLKEINEEIAKARKNTEDK